MKKTILILFLSINTFSFSQESKLENLNVEIINWTDVGSVFGFNPNNPSNTKYAQEGMSFIMIKLRITNNGQNLINIDFNDVYLSDSQGKKHPFSFFYGFSSKKLELKSGKKVKKIIYFEFPNEEPIVNLTIGKKEYGLN